MNANIKLAALKHWHTPPRITTPDAGIKEKILRNDDLWIQWRRKAREIKEQKIMET